MVFIIFVSDQLVCAGVCIILISCGTFSAFQTFLTLSKKIYMLLHTFAVCEGHDSPKMFCDKLIKGKQIT
jgi:hypothetical protein